MPQSLREFLRVTGERPGHDRGRDDDGRRRPLLDDDVDDGADLVTELHRLLAPTVREG